LSLKQHMKKHLLFLIFSVLSTIVLAQKPTPHIKMAVQVLEQLNNKEYAKIIANCDSSVLSKIDASKLEQVWTGLLGQLGPVKKTGEPVLMEKEGVGYVDQLCEFEKVSLVFRLGFNKSNKINTLLFLPAPPKENYREPSYCLKDRFEEKEIVVRTGTFELPGTFTFPKTEKKFPVVILVHGSGPNGRDESIGSIKVFKDLAYGLASSGVGVIRYDKRTSVYGTKSAADIDSITVKEEVTDDVASAVKLAKTLPGVDTTKIFLIGHSLGAMLMPRIATDIPGLAGVVMMAGNARPLEDVYLDQVIYLQNLDKNFTEEERKTLGEVKLQCLRVKKLGHGFSPAASELPLNINAKYWRDLNNYKQTQVAGALTLPILILQGQRDYQVTMTDYNLWDKELFSKKNVTLHSYPKLNHAFTEGEGVKSSPGEYEIPANVPEYVIKDILSFIKK
jgi:dienelactone hydrolase